MIESRRVTFNGVDLFEVAAVDDHPVVQSVDGLGGPSWSAPSGDRVGRDGSWAGTPRRAARSVTLSGVTISTDRTGQPDPIASERWGDRLVSVGVGKSLPLTFHYASGPRTMLTRMDGAVRLERRLSHVLDWQLPLVADDPSFYLGDGVNPAWTATTTRTHEVGGLTFPIVFPLVFDSTLVAGQLEYRNPGTTGRLQFRLDGPLTDPLIRTTNSLGTRTLAWNITIPAGGWLLIDPQARTAKLNGQSSRPPVQRGWPTLTSGLHTFRFHAFGDSSGTLTTYAWPAY